MDTQAEHAPDSTSSGKEYERPELTVWGSVTELTATGCTNPGHDFQGGSMNSGASPGDQANGSCPG
jgi:hypothetical protein